MSPSRTSRFRSQRGDAGFTLIEVLIAFAIGTTALAALFYAFSAGLDATERVERAAKALALARSILERAGADIPVQVGEWSGDVDGAAWQLKISPSDAIHWPALGNAPDVPYAVEVAVRSGDAEPITLRTVRLGVRPNQTERRP